MGIYSNIIESIPFYFPKILHEFPLTDAERINLKITERKDVCDWCEENLQLPEGAYLYPGNFKAWAWQREPINSFMYWDRICFMGAVQTFKSGMAELMCLYAMRVLSLNGMIAYANEKKIVDAFEDKFVPMIKRNKIMSEIWNKKVDTLTQDKLRLNTCIWKIASANNPNDLASFPAPVSYGSEVAKWQEKVFNPVNMLRGRSDSSFTGGIRKSILESSPYEYGDYLYQEVYRNGTLILTPHYKCPHCGVWQELTDRQIKLRDKNFPHTPEFLRSEKVDACFYECSSCQSEITEEQRVPMSEAVVWAAPDVESEGYFGIDNIDEGRRYKQRAEKITDDGTIPGRLKGGVRKGFDTVCYNWNRLVDVSFPFWECLARHFDSVHAPEKKKVYENETMARYWKRKTKRVELSYLDTRKLDYRMFGEGHYVPEDVLVITLGIDTQDSGFYYTFVGWGYMLSWYILRHGFIPCKNSEKGYEHQVFELFNSRLYASQLRFSDGTIADYRMGLIDRGGHRPDDVDYICKNSQRLHPYIGMPKEGPEKPIISRSENSNHYNGQSSVLSEDTGTIIASDRFWLPFDVEPDFCKQILRQFHHEKQNTDGSIKRVWVHNHMGDDHYRDTLNLAWGAGKILNLDKILHDKEYCESLKDNRNRVAAKQIVDTHKKDSMLQMQRSKINEGRYTNYYTRAIRGRR